MWPSYLPCAMLQQKARHSFIQSLLYGDTVQCCTMLRYNSIVILKICGSICIMHKAPWFPHWMNGGCSRRTVLFTSHLLKRGRRSRCFQLLPSHYLTIKHNNINSSCSESHFISIVPLNLTNLPSYHTHSSRKFLSETRQNKSLVLTTMLLLLLIHINTYLFLNE